MTDGICGQLRSDNTPCPNKAGCRIRHAAPRNKSKPARMRKAAAVSYAPPAQPPEPEEPDPLTPGQPLVLSQMNTIAAGAEDGVIEIDIRAESRDVRWRDIKDAVKFHVPGVRWHPSSKMWVAPDTREAREAVLRISEGDVEIPPPVFYRDGNQLQITSFYGDERIDRLKRKVAMLWDKKSKCYKAPIPRTAAAWDAFRESVAASGCVLDDEVDQIHQPKKRTFVRPVGENLGVTLYTWQNTAADFIASQRGAILADQPGLGKTFSSLAAVEATNSYPVLVTCPTFLRTNWHREAQTCLPDRNIAVISPDTQDTVDIDNADVIICGYDTLKRYSDQIPQSLGAIIADESHYLKNPKAARTKTAVNLSHRVRSDGIVCAMTGTPIISTHRDLLPSLQLTDRLTEFGGYRNYLDRYCRKPVRIRGALRETWQGVNRPRELHSRLTGDNIMLRRLKSDVADLPPKLRADRLVDMPPGGRKVYDLIRRHCEEELEEFAQNPSKFARSAPKRTEQETINDQRSANQAAGIILSAADAGTLSSANKRRIQHLLDDLTPLTKINLERRMCAALKMPAVCDLISDRLTGDNTKKLVVFAHHRSSVDQVATQFDAPKIYGGVSHAKRQADIDRFTNDPECRVIVCSPQAAGAGLNLQVADHVVFAESPWTAAECEQAEDRCHRIGQDRTVTVEYLHASNSIDERIAETVRRKGRTAEIVVDGAD